MNKWLLIYINPSKNNLISETKIFNDRLDAVAFLEENLFHNVGIYEITGRKFDKAYEWKVVDIG